jgi:aminoglycoside/choline kinase family phosphotransferase
MKELLGEVRIMVDQLIQGDEEVARFIGRSATIEKLEKLPGDASTRRYYRIHAKGGTSYILMRMEPFEKEGLQLPFVVIRNHLAAVGVDVPAILDIDPSRGFMLLEDLGDVMLLRKLQEVSSPDVERQLYERVIDSLVDMHLKASPRPGGPELDSFKLRFDLEKLMWEINFTIEHFYLTYLKRAIPEAERDLMRRTFTEICQTLADQPTVYTHRDFHSRNVMVHGDRLVMIDFQDARMGPAQYDLASLLKDSYYQLEERQIDKLLDYYIIRWETLSGQKVDRAEFRRIFDLMSVQRNFKAIGSFASFLNRRGNASYLKYIGNTFENIRRTLLKYPQYAPLREVLFHWYYF